MADRQDAIRAQARREVGKRVLAEKRHREREAKRIVHEAKAEAAHLTLAITEKIHIKEIFSRRTENQWTTQKNLRVLANSMRSHTERTPRLPSALCVTTLLHM